MLVIFLLKWYLDYGLVVSRIYIVIESFYMNCFVDFKDNVVNVRRRGDFDKFFSVILDIVKVEGNFVYGSLLLNKDNFINIFFF